MLSLCRFLLQQAATPRAPKPWVGALAGVLMGAVAIYFGIAHFLWPRKVARFKDAMVNSGSPSTTMQRLYHRIHHSQKLTRAAGIGLVLQGMVFLALGAYFAWCQAVLWWGTG
jgi:hypothetical protein